MMDCHNDMPIYQPPYPSHSSTAFQNPFNVSPRGGYCEVSPFILPKGVLAQPACCDQSQGSERLPGVPSPHQVSNNLRHTSPNLPNEYGSRAHKHSSAIPLDFTYGPASVIPPSYSIEAPYPVSAHYPLLHLEQPKPQLTWDATRGITISAYQPTPPSYSHNFEPSSGEPLAPPQAVSPYTVGATYMQQPHFQLHLMGEQPHPLVSQRPGMSPYIDILSQAPYFGPYGPVEHWGAMTTPSFTIPEIPQPEPQVKKRPKAKSDVETEVDESSDERESGEDKEVSEGKEEKRPKKKEANLKELEAEEVERVKKRVVMPSYPRKAEPSKAPPPKVDIRPKPTVRETRRKSRVLLQVEKPERKVAIKARVRPGTVGKAKRKTMGAEFEHEVAKRFHGRRRKMLDEFESRMYYHYELPTVCKLVQCRIPELFLPPCLSTTPVYEFAQSEA